MTNFISTVSGRQFHFGDHRRMVDAISIEDIAHSLGNICRFTGHSVRFYSVAEHSINVSYCLPRELALLGLLHDATEAYCTDIAKPLKELLPDYREIEQQIWLAVAEKFSLPVGMPDNVKIADAQMLKLECRLLLPTSAFDRLNLPGHYPANVEYLHCYDPEYSKYMFMQRYKELTRGG